MSPVAELMEEIVSDDVLDRAYAWMCESRKDYSANSDVWDVRWKWRDIKPAQHGHIQKSLSPGFLRVTIRFHPTWEP